MLEQVQQKKIFPFFRDSPSRSCSRHLLSCGLSGWNVYEIWKSILNMKVSSAKVSSLLESLESILIYLPSIKKLNKLFLLNQRKAVIPLSTEQSSLISRQRKLSPFYRENLGSSQVNPTSNDKGKETTPFICHLWFSLDFNYMLSNQIWFLYQNDFCYHKSVKNLWPNQQSH